MLNIKGWGRTPQRHVIVYCNIRLTQQMAKYSINNIQKELAKEIQEENKKLENILTESSRSTMAASILAREDMVPYKHLKSLAELPLGSTYTIAWPLATASTTARKNLLSS